MDTSNVTAVKEQILTEIQRLASELGRAPGKKTFEAETGIRESAWAGVYWVNWSDAVKEAGHSPNVLQPKIPDDVLLARVAAIVRQFGRVPTSRDLRLHTRNNPDGVNQRTLDKRYGNKASFLQAFRSWAMSRDGYDDILAILGTEVSPPNDEAASAVTTKEGRVYLLKSGTFYKIGRTDEIDRRVREIRVAQPEGVDIVHIIRTDDPSGIENYWHRRFADRRANGEWFKLSSADVKAFRRRTFQ